MLKTAIATAALLVAASAPALAVNISPVNGNSCQPTAQSRASVDVSEWGVQNNSTSTSARVHCPIVYSLQKNAPYVVAVDVYDRHPTENIVCTLRGQESDGRTVLTRIGYSSGGGAGGGVQKIVLALDNSPSRPVYYSLQCELPKAVSGWVSHIASITAITES